MLSIVIIIIIMIILPAIITICNIYKQPYHISLIVKFGGRAGSISSISNLITTIADTLASNLVKEGPMNFQFSPSALAVPQL